MADALYGGKPVMQDIVIIGIDDQSLQSVGRWPWDRRNFSILLDRAAQARVVGVDVAFLEPSGAAADAALAKTIAARPAEHPVVLVSEYTTFTADGLGETFLAPVPPIAATGVATGYANIPMDVDGTVRSINLDVGEEPAFSARLYEAIEGRPLPRSTRYLINFPGEPYSFPYYSAGDVIAGEIPASAFDGKIVLVGATARDMHDDAIVPTSEGIPMPGVEIHASALQTMLLGDELSPAPVWLTILTILVAAMLVGIMVSRINLWLAGVGAVVLVVLYTVVAFTLFDKNIIPNIFYIPFTIIITFLVVLAMDLIIERIARAKVASAFGKYVSPQLLEQIMERDVKLGGERKELTILFSDIRGFTSISEALSPEDLVDFLNSYFTRVTRIIMDEKGLVDKFIGDAIMAFWNAPISDAHHADHAVIAALGMKEQLALIREEHGDKYPKLDVGIGLNTGDAVVGNVGSSERLSYTAIGDCVNLASRLEGLTKEYGVHIIISENTKRKLKQSFALRELDRVKVKGKKEPVVIFEVVGKHADDATAKWIKEYERGLRQYYKGEWKEAIAILSKLEDKTSKLIIGRCEEYVQSPPEHWDGAYQMTHK
jgi:adenylate cyclase